jgi:UDP-MurNAc hydroxylase
MKITYLASATVLIEHKNTKILTDPWLVAGEYYGSWDHYPPLEIDYSMFDDVDYIYITHIHPDHMSKGTLDRIKKDIPIIIHNYDAKFVKLNLERWGRKVIELNHGAMFHCGDGLNLHVYAADNCNPQACFKFLGCGKVETKMGSTGIDTLAVIENGEKAILNVNDCPYELSAPVMDRILERHPAIDLLLVGYAGAGSYPQCWESYSNEEKLNVYGQNKKTKLLTMGLNFLKKVKPTHYMPFAGTYTLRGKLAYLERYKVVPELSEALSHYQENYPYSNGFLLNSCEYFDLETGQVSNKYKATSFEERINYAENVLSQHKYEYEYDDQVTVQAFKDILGECYTRFDNKRKEFKFTSDTNVYVYLPEQKMIQVSCKGAGYKIINQSEFDDNRYVTYRVDPKLLYRILRGPRYAHWNNAEIGSHIQFARKPDIYERGLYYCMNYFHV